jgi:hypothetical protein
MTPRATTARVATQATAKSSWVHLSGDAPETGVVTGQMMQRADCMDSEWLVKVYDTENNLLGAELARADGSFCVNLDRKPVTPMLVVRVTPMNDAFANPMFAALAPEAMEAVALWDGGTVLVQLAETGAVPARLATPKVTQALLPVPQTLPAPEVPVAKLAEDVQPAQQVQQVQQAQVAEMAKGVCVSDAGMSVSGKASARVKLPNTRMQGGGTVTAWFNFQMPVSEHVQQVFDVTSRDGALAALLLHDGVLWLKDKNGSVVARSFAGWQMCDGWHHVAIQTTDAVGSGASACSRWSVWVDGVEVLATERVPSFALTLAAGRTNVWRVSLGNCELGDYPMAGLVGGSKIWNAVLTPQEVRDEMAAVLRNDARLKGCWPLDTDLCNSLPRGERAVLLGAATLVCNPYKSRQVLVAAGASLVCAK